MTRSCKARTAVVLLRCVSLLVLIAGATTAKRGAEKTLLDWPVAPQLGSWARYTSHPALAYLGTDFGAAQM
jgi:hypothetical protein